MKLESPSWSIHVYRDQIQDVSKILFSFTGDMLEMLGDILKLQIVVQPQSRIILRATKTSWKNLVTFHCLYN